MKSIQSKNMTAPGSDHLAFFQKERNDNFFGKGYQPKPFFTFTPVQTKLTIGQPNDIYEKEADSMADKVVQNPALQRKRSSCEKEKEEMVQSKSNGNEATITPPVESSINSSKGKGNTIAANTLHSMNQSFGANFNDVKIHTDENAAKINQQLNSQAFTTGNDIYFNSGKYNETSTKGKHLLAHELTHVIQQNHTVSKKTILQRQPGKVDDVKQQYPWEDAFISIFIEDRLHCQQDHKTKDISCNDGYANVYGSKLLSTYGPVRTCAGPATFHFKIMFAVDALGSPRPRPFTEPFLKANLDFIPNGKKISSASLHGSGKGKYMGEGQPLGVSWFPDFIFDTKENGVVKVELEMNDPDTGFAMKYTDTIICELFPCA